MQPLYWNALITAFLSTMLRHNILDHLHEPTNLMNMSQHQMGHHNEKLNGLWDSPNPFKCYCSNDYSEAGSCLRKTLDYFILHNCFCTFKVHVYQATYLKSELLLVAL